MTFINTNKLPRKSASGHGEMTEVLNEALCGAKNIVASLHWLKVGDIFLAKATDKHQLVYLMDGKGRITLNDKDYSVAKGAGAYLGPSETAKIEATNGTVKLFVLVVPKIPKCGLLPSSADEMAWIDRKIGCPHHGRNRNHPQKHLPQLSRRLRGVTARSGRPPGQNRRRSRVSAQSWSFVLLPRIELYRRRFARVHHILGTQSD